jgi:hypothetical protein
LTRAWIGLAAATLLGAATLSAQEKDPREVQPERPTVATHAGTVAPGYLEIEAGGEHDRFSPAVNSELAPIVLKFGVAKNAQLSVFGSEMHAGGQTGLGDLAVGVKWRLLDDAPIVGDFAILPAIKFPTGASDRGFGTGTTDASLLLISSHTFGDISMDLNAGITRRSGDGTAAPRTASVWTASFGGPFTEAIGWTAELYGYPATSGPAGASSIAALLGGPTARIRKYLAVDAGVIIPLAGAQPHAVYAGGVYNVGRLW